MEIFHKETEQKKCYLDTLAKELKAGDDGLTGLRAIGSFDEIQEKNLMRVSV